LILTPQEGAWKNNQTEEKPDGFHFFFLFLKLAVGCSGILFRTGKAVCVSTFLM